MAVYDKTTRIGGLIHILLPEPPGILAAEFPEKYASTGIPSMIKSLVDQGARPDQMEATIAGGALVGPVTQQDINLDIGGRSFEIAESILKASEIKVLKSETGGFFTCTLELNMATGEATIQPAWEDMIGGSTDFSPPSIQDINDTIETLTPIPQTALKIIRMVNDDRYDMDKISDELSKDQVLSAQTLKVCNSAIFTGSVKIDTLKEAVVLLGQDMLIKSVITAAVNNYFSQATVSGYSLCKGGLFFHAVGVGTMAENIAGFCKKSTPKHAYAAGLLHDIGKVVLDQFVSRGAPLFFRNMNQEEETGMTTEKKLLGINHCEAGSFLAKRWQFSAALNDVIIHHHRPENATKNTELVCIVYLADLLMAKFGAGLEREKVHAEPLDYALDLLGMTADGLPKLIDTIPNNDQLQLL